MIVVAAAVLSFVSRAGAKTAPAATSDAAPQINLSVLKSQCVRYHDSGQYMRDIAAVDQQAAAYLEAHHAMKKPAIVLDIDETSISNWKVMRAYDFGYNAQVWDRYFATHAAEPIPPTLKLYNEARRLHVAVFFVTGRSAALRQATIHDLKTAGYSGWSGLYFAPQNYHKPTLAIFKTQARKEIAAKGWHIVLNIGDQKSDLAGGYADRGFKLPNPMYIVP